MLSRIHFCSRENSRGKKKTKLTAVQLPKETAYELIIKLLP